jgi:hypothetical protein
MLKFMAEALIIFLKVFILVIDFLLLHFYCSDNCDVGSHKGTWWKYHILICHYIIAAVFPV